MEELIESFDVEDERGEVHRIYIYQEIIDAGTIKDPNATIRGMKRIVMENGEPVNYIDENTFLRVITAAKLSRI